MIRIREIALPAEHNVEQLSYVNSANICYLYLDGSIQQINLSDQSYVEIASQLQEDSSQVSKSEEMLVSSTSFNAARH